MRSRHVLGILLCIFFSSARLSSAQTPHPCDAPPSSSGTLREGSATLTYCVDSRDSSIASQALYVDTSNRFSITGTPSGSPSPVSLKQLMTTGIQIVRGSHRYEIASVNTAGEEGPKSDPFVLTVNPPLPAKPSIAGIRQP